MIKTELVRVMRRKAHNGVGIDLRFNITKAKSSFDIEVPIVLKNASSLQEVAKKLEEVARDLVDPFTVEED